MGADGGAITVLDEPTTGLPSRLIAYSGFCGRLVDSGKSVIVIEHHQSGDGARRLDHRYPGQLLAGITTLASRSFRRTWALVAGLKSTLTGGLCIRRQR